jgi:hypothetical protein
MTRGTGKSCARRRNIIGASLRFGAAATGSSHGPHFQADASGDFFLPARASGLSLKLKTT